ncbi:hypothetical protein DFH09DRAFT_1126471 [Mycena vulgaris]|nr:hypothetical protein DFH09DRAFT_1126471 [Mycena vulgaris]
MPAPRTPTWILAPEMLYEIFSWTEPDPDETTIPPSNTQSPWNFTRSSIHVGARLTPRALEALKAQLERSNAHLLNVTLTSLNGAALELLLDHSMRWETAHLALDRPMITALDRISGYLPELRSFRLKYTGSRAGAAACRVFETAPKLSEVIIHGDPSLPLPLSQLLRARVGISSAPHQLGSARHLLQLSLHGLPDTPATPIELPRLRTLLVVDGAFLDSLILPELDELLVAADCLPIIPMIRRSQCCLQKLCLIRCSTTEGRAVLAGIPTLVELRWPATEKLLGRLIKHPSFLPELRAMWLLRFEDEQFPTVKLVTLMESRRTPPLSLRMLNFLTTTKSDATVQLEAKLRHQGIDAEWFNRGPSVHMHTEYTNTYP